MGIICAPDEFQAVMQLMFGDLEFVYAYLGDLLVVLDTWAEHMGTTDDRRRSGRTLEEEQPMCQVN